MDERLSKLFRQMEAFDSISMECDRCADQVTLLYLTPTVRGFVCRRCLHTMPYAEWQHLRATL